MAGPLGARAAESGEVVDAVFAITCRSLPVDHAWALSQAVQAGLPWLAGEPGAGLHLVHGAASGSGWMRPAGEGAMLQLSHRATLALRLPASRLTDAEQLCGREFDIAGCALRTGAMSVRPLSRITTLFSRCVVLAEALDEPAFLEAASREFQALGIESRRMLCGLTTALATPGETYQSRSLMLAGLTIEHSLELQRTGLGIGRLLGCGLFIPHKDIADLRSRTE